jgi:hypothetical protein
MADMWTIDPYTPTGTGNGYLPTGTWGSQPNFVENTWWKQPMRRASLDQLVQLLNKQRDELYASSAGGQAQPYAVPKTVGLLGF